MFNKKLLLSFLATLILLLASCSTKNNFLPYKDQFIVFGTEVNVTIYAQDSLQAKKAIESVRSRFYQLHHEWHAWERGGIVSKINQAIENQQPIKVSADVKDFIIKSQQLAKQSNYLFDPGIGQLIQLWGFHSEDWQGPPPSAKQRQNWLDNRPSIADLKFDGLMLSSSNQNVSLDFGGNAKGLALDIAIASLKKAGIQNAIVNIGGDMRIIGNKQGKENLPWTVSINNPFSPNHPIASIQLQGDESIVTSGSSQRYFKWQGQVYSHIINPNTALPANSFASVTIVHSDATTADAAATAIMVAGNQYWQQVAKQMGIDTVFIVDQEQQVITTPKMQQRINLLQQPQ